MEKVSALIIHMRMTTAKRELQEFLNSKPEIRNFTNTKKNAINKDRKLED